jgi:hypothetical protein
MPMNEKVKRELAEEVDLLDTMLTSLVELLEEKGIVSQQEWEKRIKEKILINLEHMKKKKNGDRI